MAVSLGMNHAHLALALAIVAGVVVLALLLRRGPVHALRPANYRLKRLLSRWEVQALGRLRAELPAEYHACPQVRLADLLTIDAGDASRHRSALNYVAKKSLDLVVIDMTGRAVLAIELDDRTHDRPDRRRRDAQVETVLAHCGLRLLRVRPGQSIDIRQHLPAASRRVA